MGVRVAPDDLPDEIRIVPPEDMPDGLTPPTSPPEEKTLAGFGSNLLSSGAKFAGDIGQAAMAAPGLLYKGATQPNQFAAGAMEASKGIPAYLSERYGGSQQILDTLYKDPVGFAADLSTVFSGAGAAAKFGKLGKVASALKKTSAVVDPLAQTGRALRAPAAALGRGLGAPEMLYSSALKPSTAGPGGVAKSRARVASGLREEIPVTEAGLGKTRDIIDDLKAKVDAEIAAIPAGAEVDPLDMALKAQPQVRNKFEGVTKADDWRKIDDTLGTFLEGHPDPKNPAQLQKFKVDSHRSLKEKAYGEQKGPGAETEKTLTRMAKEKLEEWVGNDANGTSILGRLNQREGSLIALEKELGKAVARIQKHQVFGIGTPAMGGLGYTLGGQAGAWTLAVLKVALDQPGLKSHLAFAIKRAKGLKQSKVLTPASTAVRATEDDE